MTIFFKECKLLCDFCLTLNLNLNIMNNLLLAGDFKEMLPNDYVGFTFFVGCMAMMAASAFSFYQ